MTERWDQVRGWFERVADLDTAAREALLARECVDDDVRREVLELCGAGERAGAPLEPSSGFRGSLGGGLAAGDSAAEDEAERGMTLGPWRLEEPLGKGGMGTVWSARREDDAFDKTVAIKLVKRGLDTDEILARFRRERQVLAALEHPGIARLYDGGVAPDGRPYMVLERVEGEPIDAWCDARDLGLRARLELFLRVCDAVRYAHSHLVVHRDIKPSNVLVTADGAPKLLDFGVAKLLAPEAGERGLGTLTTGAGFLTPEYASPEQVRGLPVTTATDVYSLGVLLYRLLTGEPPYRFDGRGAAELERVVCHVDPARPSTLPGRRALAGDLDTILLKALRKEPERRYATVEELGEDLRRHLDGRTVRARPDTAGYRAGKFVRRNPALVGAVAAVLGVLAVSLAVYSRLLGDARAANADAARRFAGLRELTGELIFDLHDQIADLPGATGARYALIEAALDHMGALAADAPDDPEMLSELAAAYLRLGEVLGRPTAASLGDTRAALAAHERERDLFARALAALERVGGGSAGERAALRVRHALAIDRIAAVRLYLGDADEALRELDEALAVVRVHGGASDQAAVEYHRAQALVALGRTAEGLAQLDLCLATARRAVERAPEDHVALRTLQVALFRSADLRSANLELERAEREIVEAVGVAERLLDSDGVGGLDAGAERDLALALAMLARVRLQSNRPDDAEDAVARQLALFLHLAEADPRNATAQRDLSIAWERDGALHEARGDLDAALASYTRCVEIDEAALAADPTSAALQRNLGVALDKACGATLELGRLAEGLALAQRMVATLQPALEAEPDDVEAGRLLAIGHMRVGQLHLESGAFADALLAFALSRDAFAKLAAGDRDHAWTNRLAMVAVYFVGWAHRELGHDPSLPATERAAHLRAACDALGRSVEMHRDLARRGMLQPGDEAQAAETETELEACRARLAALEGDGA